MRFEIRDDHVRIDRCLVGAELLEDSQYLVVVCELVSIQKVEDCCGVEGSPLVGIDEWVVRDKEPKKMV